MTHKHTQKIFPDITSRQIEIFLHWLNFSTDLTRPENKKKRNKNLCGSSRHVSRGREWKPLALTINSQEFSHLPSFSTNKKFLTANDWKWLFTVSRAWFMPKGIITGSHSYIFECHELLTSWLRKQNRRYYIFAASTVNSGPLFLISEKLIFFVASYLKTH